MSKKETEVKDRIDAYVDETWRCWIDQEASMKKNGLKSMFEQILKDGKEMGKKEDKSQINQLTDLYVKWGEKNNIKDLTSADEVILREGLSDNQRKWLEEFIESWDMAMDVDRYIHVQNKKKGETR